HPARGHWRPADCWDDYYCGRWGDRAVVHFHVRICRQGYPSAVRSPSPSRCSRTVPVRAKRNVYRRDPRAARRGAVLRIDIDLDVCRRVLSRGSTVRCFLRGADFTANFRVRIRMLLPPGAEMLAKESRELKRMKDELDAATDFS